MKRKLIYVLIIGLLFIGNAFAGDLFKRYEITYNPSISSNQMKVFGYLCLDNSCSNMDETMVKFYRIGLWNVCIQGLQSGSITSTSEFENCARNYEIAKNTPIEIINNERIVVRYIDAQPNEKFATYYFAKDYVGKVNVFTVDVCNGVYCVDDTITTLQINKKDRVDFQINNFQVENMHNASQPLFIDVPVSIESQICNNLRFSGIVGYYPPEDGVYVDYSIDGYAHLSIFDSNNNQIYYDILLITVPVSTCSTSVSFTYTPSQTGNLTVELNAETYDSKVIQRTNTTAQAKVYIYDNNAACQTVLTDLIVTDEFGDSRIQDNENLKIGFSYNSQVYLSPLDIRPANTRINVEILDQNNNRITTYTDILNSNNIVDLKSFSKIFDSLSSGSYKVRITGSAFHNLCSSLPNNPAILELDFTVYRSSYNVLFVVRDSTNLLPIENAIIQISNYTITTNTSGMASIRLSEGSYSYVVSKAGYYDSTGNINNLNQDITIYISLTPIPDTISNNPPQVISFTANVTSGNKPLDVLFIFEVSDPDNDVLTCYIDFDGDGNYDKTINSCNSGSDVFRYGLSGNYFAKLRVEDGQSFDERTLLIEVLEPNVLPYVFVSSNVTSGFAPLYFELNWNVYDSNGDTLTCYIDLENDGLNEHTITSCYNSSRILNYANPGNYTLKFSVSDGSGVVERYLDFEVLPYPSEPRLNNPPQIITFTATPTSGYAPLNVTFTINVSDDKQLCNVTLEFGDSNRRVWDICSNNTKSFYTTINHIYSNTGNYMARLIAVDNDSESTTRALNIIVSSLPSGEGGGRTEGGTRGGGISLSGFAIGPISKGDVVIKDVLFPEIVYLNETYTLSVKVKNRKSKEVKGLLLYIEIGSKTITKIFSINKEETKNFNFDIKITDSFNLGDNKIKVKIKKGNKIIDEKDKEFVVKERVPIIEIFAKERYNADESVRFNVCVDNKVNDIIRVYVDDVLKRVIDLKGEKCANVTIGNTFSLGEHTIKVFNGKYYSTREFEINKIISITDVEIDKTLIKDKTYKVEITVETQIPSAIMLKMYEDKNLIKVVEAFISDKEKIEIEYRPTSTGEKTLKFVVENGENNTDEVSIKVKVVDSSFTGWLVKYLPTTGLILGSILVLLILIYFSM